MGYLSSNLTLIKIQNIPHHIYLLKDNFYINNLINYAKASLSTIQGL